MVGYGDVSQCFAFVDSLDRICGTPLDGLLAFVLFITIKVSKASLLGSFVWTRNQTRSIVHVTFSLDIIVTHAVDAFHRGTRVVDTSIEIFVFFVVTLCGIDVVPGISWFSVVPQAKVVSGANAFLRSIIYQSLIERVANSQVFVSIGCRQAVGESTPFQQLADEAQGSYRFSQIIVKAIQDTLFDFIVELLGRNGNMPQ